MGPVCVVLLALYVIASDLDTFDWHTALKGYDGTA